MLLPSCFLTGFVCLPTSAQPLHLAVARYAFDEMPAHLLNNRTKPVKDANDRFGFKIMVAKVWFFVVLPKCPFLYGKILHTNRKKER
ncbi:hypothetical protein [Prevotella falsenii]|uniref:hypothetical protein n=1 Tax=Prevotella falsenii TaxID=515414 RepID=UPI0012EB5C9E|nr:hypothetical protein [Prevotella falsenii]